MHWEKTITIHLTLRSLVGAILTASTVVNLLIVGAAYGANVLPATPTLTATVTTAVSTTAVINPTWTVKAMLTSTLDQIPGSTPTNTPSITPRNTLAPTETSTDVPLSIVCVKRFYWPTYRVQPGDWLSSLAVATGTRVDELMAANCLSNDRIFVGQILHVPRLPVTITPILSATPTATVTATGTATATSTPSATPSQTQTATYTPTNTASITPTDTATPTPTATNSPPKVYILSPTDGSSYKYDGLNQSNGWYTNIELIGSASDAEDDVLSDSSLVWTTDRKEIQDPFLGNGITLKTTLYSNVCSGEWHTITLTGVDSNGAAASETIRVFIGDSQQC